MEDSNQTSQTQQQVNSTPPAVNSGKSKLVPVILGVAAAIVIAIGAYLLGIKHAQPVVQNQQSSVVPTPTPNPTANLKTLNDNTNGISIKYPTNWTVLPAGSTKLAEQTLQDYALEIEKQLAKPGLAGLRIIPPDNATKRKPVAKREIVIKDTNNKFLGRGVLVAYVLKDTITVITIQAFPTDKVKDIPFTPEEKQIFDQILATFKFTNEKQTVDNNDWKLLQAKSSYNPEVKFTLSYPNDCALDLESKHILKCKDFILNAQAGGRGSFVPKVDEVKLNNILWERRRWQSGKDITPQDASSFDGASYGAGISGKYSLIEITYLKYSIEAEEKVEQILSAFKFLPASPTGGNQSEKVEISDGSTYAGKNFTIVLPKSWEIINGFRFESSNIQLRIMGSNRNEDELAVEYGLGSQAKQTRKVTLGIASGTEYFGCVGVEGCIDMYVIIAKVGSEQYEIVYEQLGMQIDDTLYKSIISTLKFTQ